MSSNIPYFDFSPTQNKKKEKYFLHIILFLATFFSVSLAGVNWAGKNFLDLANIHHGFLYGLLIIIFLTSHEFGHYIAARIHKVDSTLPFYIPLPPAPGIPSLFGTMGAVIKTRSPILTRKALFDIGIAGPIAGFIVSLIFLIYGFMSLPGIEFIYKIHPEYLLYNNGEIPTGNLHFGDTLLYYILSNTIANPDGFLPPMNEMYHYPFLNAGWFGLFVTSLNLMPIGQLDGGHIVYAMFGKNIQFKIAKIFWWIIMVIGILSTFGIILELIVLIPKESFFYFIKVILEPPLAFLNTNIPWLFHGWAGWLFWGLITKFFIWLKHPPIQNNDELSKNRMLIGYIAMVIFILSLSLNGIYFIT